MGDVVDAPVSELWDANGAEPSTSFSAREAAVLACRAAWAEMLPALAAMHGTHSISSSVARSKRWLFAPGSGNRFHPQKSDGENGRSRSRLASS